MMRHERIGKFAGDSFAWLRPGTFWSTALVTSPWKLAGMPRPPGGQRHSQICSCHSPTKWPIPAYG